MSSQPTWVTTATARWWRPLRRFPAGLAHAVFVLLMLSGASVQAHKASDAYLTLAVDGAQIDLRWDIALRDLDRELQVDADDDGRLTWGEVLARWPQIEALAASALALRADGSTCEGGRPGPPMLDTHSDGRYAVLTRQWRCEAPVQRLQVAYGLFERSDPSHRGVMQLRSGGAVRPAVLVPGAAAQPFEVTAGEARAAADRIGLLAGFVREGVHHILIGIDHLLFLLSLLLPLVLPLAPPGRERQPATRLRPVLVEVTKVVTAFTLAHSITLALAVFDVLDPPSRWIESAIAASVVLAALNNLWPVIGEGRWKLTFMFGLVHGFGFAGALKDLGLAEGALALPLLGFNLGVELGQLLVVAVFLPIAWALRGTTFYRRGVLASGSALIAAIALVWLVQRAFDLALLPGLA